MINIPKEITYAELYYTLKCNLKCEYCINAADKIQRTREEQSYKVLADAVNNIDFDNLSLTIGGGEPTIRSDFYQFVDELREGISIDLLTNMQFDVKRFTQDIKPSKFTTMEDSAYKSIRISYHPSQMDREQIVYKARRLQDYGFSVGIFGIAHPLNIGDNIHMSELCRRNNIYFFVKEYMGEFDNQMFGYYKYKDAIAGPLKTMECRTSELLIDPGGNMYKCHRDLYVIEHSIGNIIDKDPIEFKYRMCNNYGRCNPCDVKSKVNAKLTHSRCSVEIKSVQE